MYPLTWDHVLKKLVHRYQKNISLEVTMVTFSSFSCLKNVVNFDQNFRPFPVQSRCSISKWIPRIKKWSGSDILEITYVLAFVRILWKHVEKTQSKIENICSALLEIWLVFKVPQTVKGWTWEAGNWHVRSCHDRTSLRCKFGKIWWLSGHLENPDWNKPYFFCSNPILYWGESCWNV